MYMHSLSVAVQGAKNIPSHPVRAHVPRTIRTHPVDNPQLRISFAGSSYHTDLLNASSLWTSITMNEKSC